MSNCSEAVKRRACSENDVCPKGRAQEGRTKIQGRKLGRRWAQKVLEARSERVENP